MLSAGRVVEHRLVDVGAPGRIVIRSASIRRMVCSGSYTSCGTIVAPVSKQTRMPAL